MYSDCYVIIVSELVVNRSGLAVYKYFLPDEYVKDIFQITPEELKEKGIKGIITDLDNTLVEWDRPEATPEIMEWMKSMTGSRYTGDDRFK